MTNTPTNTPTSKCEACEKDGEILPGSVHMIGTQNCRVKPTTPTTDSKNSSEDWEKELDSMIYGKHGTRDGLVFENEFFYDREEMKDFIRSQIQQAEARGYEDGLGACGLTP